MAHISKSSARSVVLAVLTAALAVPAFAGTALADVVPGTASSSAAAVAPRQGTRVNVVGEVARYVVGPLGNVRGFLLKDGTVVPLHGDAGASMARDVPVGQSVRVEGWSPAASSGKAIMHAAVFGQHGQVVTPPARGEGGKGREQRAHEPGAKSAKWGAMKEELAKLPAASASGTVQAVIPGHKGKSVAVVLNDGTNVFFAPRLAGQMKARGIQVGDRIQAQGKGATYPLGASVLARSVTFGDGTRFEAPAPTGSTQR
jgi:hypothetical protein